MLLKICVKKKIIFKKKKKRKEEEAHFYEMYLVGIYVLYTTNKFC